MRKLSAGLALFLSLFLLAFLFAAPEPVNTSERLLSPSSVHPFGTDCYGRDLLAVTSSGLCTSFLVASAVTLLSLSLALVLSFALSSRHMPKAPVMFLSDVLKSVPPLVLALFLGSLSGPGLLKLVIALSVSNIPNLARTASSKAPVLREEAYSKAAGQEGMGEAGIFIRHILPQLWPYLMLQSVSVFSSAVLAEASLSFLGAGVPLTLPSLGRLLADSRAFMLSSWWTGLFPSLALFLTGLSLELIGKGMEEIRA